MVLDHSVLLTCFTVGTLSLDARHLFWSRAVLRWHVTGNQMVILILLLLLAWHSRCVGYGGELDLRTKAPFWGVPGHWHLLGDLGKFCWFSLGCMSGSNCHWHISWEITACFGARVGRSGHAEQTIIRCLVKTGLSEPYVANVFVSSYDNQLWVSKLIEGKVSLPFYSR